MSEGKAVSRLQAHYNDVVRAKLQEEFNYKNTMQLPRLEKIVLNMGVGEAAADQKKLDAAFAEMTLISRSEAGQDGRQEGDRRLQDPQGSADRLQGHAPRRPDVRVPRPPGDGGAAARA